MWRPSGALDDGERGRAKERWPSPSDGRCLLISSANLTEYAFTLNMELGVLITGGELPQRVEERFDKLIEKGVLVRV